MTVRGCRDTRLYDGAGVVGRVPERYAQDGDAGRLDVVGLCALGADHAAAGRLQGVVELARLVGVVLGERLPCDQQHVLPAEAARTRRRRCRRRCEGLRGQVCGRSRVERLKLHSYSCAYGVWEKLKGVEHGKKGQHPVKYLGRLLSSSFGYVLPKLHQETQVRVNCFAVISLSFITSIHFT